MKKLQDQIDYVHDMQHAWDGANTMLNSHSPHNEVAYYRFFEAQ